ncbi:MAG: hypothetical protein IKE56_06765 [Lachnospiraceae bacterium]|nr:hypothetical protein [Lachnospiraceae bacterium]
MTRFFTKMRHLFVGAAVFLLFLASGISLPGISGGIAGGIGAAYANAPVPRYCFDITVKNAPEGTSGIDFLVPKDSIPEDEYTELNEQVLSERGLPADCEIAGYELDGAVSYSVHDSEAESFRELSEQDGDYHVWQFENGYDLVKELGQETRLVLFDEEGTVLAVSDPFKAYESKPRSFRGEISYDASTGEVISNGMAGGLTPEGEIDPGGNDGSGGGSVIASILLGLLLLVGAFIGALVITILLELIVGLFFHLKPVWWVIPVNLITNLAFNLLLAVFVYLLGMNYYVFVGIGEIAVIAVEYLLYKSIYKDMPPKKLLIYSIVANVISAGAGLLAAGTLL